MSEYEEIGVSMADPTATVHLHACTTILAASVPRLMK